MATFEEVRAAEFEELEKLRVRRGVILPPGEARVGLAFSGGGIRSATINLGILQALAKYGLLKRQLPSESFTYISRVPQV